jgi:hypothetical protein
LRGNAHGFVHANRRHAGRLLAQDVSDFHRNLLRVCLGISLVIEILVYIIPIVNSILTSSTARTIE